jgi:hypothetical protein
MKHLFVLTLVLLILSGSIIGCGLLSNLLSSSCSVGIVGSDAVIDIKGPGAKRECSVLLKNTNSYFSTVEQPTKPVICTLYINSLTYTVKDEGILKIVGYGICDDLRNTSTP